jgi:putative membrane protein
MVLMSKNVIFSFFLFTASFFIFGCSRTENTNIPEVNLRPSGSAEVPEEFIEARVLSVETRQEIIEIRERMFITEVGYYQINARHYLGRTIKLEGILMWIHWDGDEYYLVYRYGPGCCGNDGIVGFEVLWSENNMEYPEHGSWVEAIGVLKRDEHCEHAIYLDLVSLTALETRGREFVRQ